MKHSWKITVILLAMFIATQLIGLFVINAYNPEIVIVDGKNVTIHKLPYGTAPPADITPGTSVVSILIAIAIAVVLMLVLMKIRAELFLRIWFFVVVALALGIAVNALLLDIKSGSIIALIIALPLAYLKIFKRNIIVHNATELLIYPGIAAIFVPLVNVWATVLLLVLISVYDAYAVWYAGFMQKMAKYQIQKLRLFTGFFVPYLGKKEKMELERMKKLKRKKEKSIKVNVAILGGGDVVFPLILAGVVLRAVGLLAGLTIVIGATIALLVLFKIGEKGKAYPAMPYITAGCLIALGAVYFIF